MGGRAGSLAIVVGALIALGGCGEDAVNEAERQGRQAQEQVEKAVGGQTLSSEAQDVLERGEELATKVADVGTDLAQGQSTEAEARQRLDAAAQGAQALGEDARDLPAADSARDRLIELADAAKQRVAEARARLEEADAAGVTDALRQLNEAARSAVDDLADRVPADVRQRLQDGLEQLGG